MKFKVGDHILNETTDQRGVIEGCVPEDRKVYGHYIIKWFGDIKETHYQSEKEMSYSIDRSFVLDKQYYRNEKIKTIFG
jgi:hypothetical protein